jgi:N-acetylmuramoyl-L-alanine amidase
VTLKPVHQFLSAWEPLLSEPQWYLTVVPEMHALTEQLGKEPDEVRQAYKIAMYDFFEDHLMKRDIALGRDLPGADAERKSIDTIVIHHTSNPPGLRPERLSAIELIRLYAPYFAHPKSKEDAQLKGQPVASGHARGGGQVFWPYHWLIRRDGRGERLLYDREIGWHAGDWDVNCRSVAIALDNDYDAARPSKTELRGIADLIKNNYRKVPLERIVGHREVNSKTICPSNLFLDGQHGRGWKEDLLELMKEGEATLRAAA